MPKLYKYLSEKVGKIVLQTGKFRWSSPSTLNDPAEFRLPAPNPEEKDRLIDLALEEAWKVASGRAQPLTRHGHVFVLVQKLNSFREEDFKATFREAFVKSAASYYNSIGNYMAEFTDLMKRDKVLCLTIDPVNPAMWAHYASNSSGIVIGLRNLKDFDSPYSQAKPVVYVDCKPPLFSLNDIARSLAGAHSLTTKEILSESLNRVTHTKLDTWAYEQEWRIYSGPGRHAESEFEDCLFHPDEIADIIFGYRCSEIYKSEIFCICNGKYKSAKYYSSHVDANGIIEIIPI